MIGKLKKFYHYFTCERYTELASQELDQPLCGSSKLGFYLHHFICTFCRRSRRQLKAIEKAAIKLDETGELGRSRRGHLSEEAKERIKSSMH